MMDWLKKLTEIRPGMRASEVLTVERVAAIQQGLRELAEGKNLVMGRHLSRGSGEGSVRLDYTGKKQRKGAKDTAPPFWSYLVKKDDAWNLWVEKGFVIIRQNFDPVITHIEPSSIPTKDAPFVVIDGSKVWVKETISATGITTAAIMEMGIAWPVSEQAELKGGDVADGVEGQRIVRVAEVMADPDSESATPGLICKQLLTGHIDAFQPELLENTVLGEPSASEERGRLLKKFDAAAGKWMVRGIEGEDGIEIEEKLEVITIKGGGGSHPWKVKPATTAGRVTVAKGFIFFPTATGESGPDGDLIMNPIEYGPQPCNDNGEIIVSGEGYIWAVVTESSYNLVSNFGTIGENGILHLRVRNSAGINAVFSAAAPSSSDTAIVYKVAKVNLVGGLAVVTEQYLTHNPTHDLAHFGNPS